MALTKVGKEGVTGISNSSNATAITIDSSENVGISNTTPGSYYSNSNQLVVGSGSARQGITIASSTSTIGQLAFADGTSGDARYEGWVLYDHNTNHMSLGTSADERMRIDSSGHILFGRTSVVDSGRAASGTLSIGGAASGTSECLMQLKHGSNTNSTQRNYVLIYNDAGSIVGSITATISS